MTKLKRTERHDDWVIPAGAFLVAVPYVWNTPKGIYFPDSLYPGLSGYSLSASPRPDGWAADEYRVFRSWPEMDVRRINREVKAAGSTILWPGDVLPSMGRDEALHLEDWIDEWQGRGKRIAAWKIPKGKFLVSGGDTTEDIPGFTCPRECRSGWYFYLRDGLTGPFCSGHEWPPIKEAYSVMHEWSGISRRRITALVEAAGRHVLWAGEIVPNMVAVMADEIERC